MLIINDLYNKYPLIVYIKTCNLHTNKARLRKQKCKNTNSEIKTIQPF